MQGLKFFLKKGSGLVETFITNFKTALIPALSIKKLACAASNFFNFKPIKMGFFIDSKA
jgi:hypothetical protein